MSQPAWAKWRESNIIGAIIGYTTIEEVIHPSTGYYQITPFVLYRLNATLHYYFSLSFFRECKVFFLFFCSFFQARKKKCLDQAEERAVRTRCVASCGLLALEGREDLSWMGRKEDFKVCVGGESDLTPFSWSMCLGL